MSRHTRVKFSNNTIVDYLQYELQVKTNDRVGNTLTFYGSGRPHMSTNGNSCLVFRRGENTYYVPLWNVYSVSEYNDE